jgi:hypothetical protein
LGVTFVITHRSTLKGRPYLLLGDNSSIRHKEAIVSDNYTDLDNPTDFDGPTEETDHEMTDLDRQEIIEMDMQEEDMDKKTTISVGHRQTDIKMFCIGSSGKDKREHKKDKDVVTTQEKGYSREEQEQKIINNINKLGKTKGKIKNLMSFKGPAKEPSTEEPPECRHAKKIDMATVMDVLKEVQEETIMEKEFKDGPKHKNIVTKGRLSLMVGNLTTKRTNLVGPSVTWRRTSPR